MGERKNNTGRDEKRGKEAMERERKTKKKKKQAIKGKENGKVKCKQKK